MVKAIAIDPEVIGSIPRLVKLNSVANGLHCCDVFSKMFCPVDRPQHQLHASG